MSSAAATIAPFAPRRLASLKNSSTLRQRQGGRRRSIVIPAAKVVLVCFFFCLSGWDDNTRDLSTSLQGEKKGIVEETVLERYFDIRPTTDGDIPYSQMLEFLQAKQVSVHFKVYTNIERERGGRGE